MGLLGWIVLGTTTPLQVTGMCTNRISRSLCDNLKSLCCPMLLIIKKHNEI
jgi:hypothetical protein